MKETLKFLKLGLIGTVSVTAMAALTVSCGKKETVNNNNQEGGGSTTNPEVEQQLSKAVAAFNVTKKQDVNLTNVLASSINKDNFLEYFVETIGSGFEKEKGFTYTLETVKPKADDATQLEVVYAISYKTATPQTKSFSFDGFKDETAIETKLQEAFEAFKIEPKTSPETPTSNVLASTIANETELEKYFDIKGKMEDVQYTFTSHKSIEEHGLEVKYTLTYQGKTKEKIFNLNGFKGVNQIDYNLENPDDFFKIALDKQHLDTIAFFAQEYNFYTQDMFKTWKLTEEPERYEATKTDQYFIFKDSKYYIWKINFKNTENLEPIIAELADSSHLGQGEIKALFTEKGKQRNPFLFAVKEETVKEN